VTEAALDRETRLLVYRRFVDDGHPPSVADVAEELSLPEDEVAASFHRLEDERALVLAPGTLNVWMANPFCAFPTTFRVATQRGVWWGTCIWDSLGIPAMLDCDATIATLCADCNEPLELRVENAGLLGKGVAHFAVPAIRWWENIGYT
jgi:hypothetical protein